MFRSSPIVAAAAAMLLVQSTSVGFAEPQAAPKAALQVVSEGPAQQWNTTRLILRSERIGRDFFVEVTAPPMPAPAGQKLPAVYTLDGGQGIVSAQVSVLIRSGRMAPAYVVSINSSSIDARNTDLFHKGGAFTKDGPVYAAGGQAFETFLLEEVRPFLQSRFPLDPDKAVLMGHSLGGTFAAHVLARNPGAFNAYLIASPGLNVDPDVLGEVARASVKGGRRRVFLGYAPQDAIDFHSDRLFGALNGSGSALEVRRQVFEDDDHLSIYLHIAPKALPFLLPPASR